MLLIMPKNVDHAVGVVSLSNIDFIHRSAETAVVIGERPTAKKSMFWAMEAKARIVQHGFETLGLRRIGGAQTMPLAVWQNYQLLFGFRPEGVARASFAKGMRCLIVSIVPVPMMIICELKICERATIGLVLQTLLKLMRSVPKVSVASLVHEAINDVVENFTKGVKF